MNIYKYLLFFILIAGLLAACGESEEAMSETLSYGSLSIDQDSLHFASSGGKDTINLTSDVVWFITFQSSSWCRPSIQTAKGNAKVIVTADENDSTAFRTQTFTLSAAGHDTIVITITQSSTEDEDETDYSEYITPDQTDMRELDALEFSKLMGVGWNIGNSLESITVSGGVYSGSETSWGNPSVTKQLIDSVKDAGFNAIRIPVSWSHKLDNTSTYKISTSWKKRVAEVVNYALDNDMFVIINVHWDGGWMNDPTYDSQTSINAKLDSLWKQIAIYFRDYDDRLLFAGTNEVHVADNYGTPTSENIAVQNSFNQTFVNAVRATGGRNFYRQLIVQAYNTNIENACSYLTMPDDQVENRLMAEVHFYDPYDFALQESTGYTTQWGENYIGGDVSSWGQEDWVDEAFGMMKTYFVDKGVPVILGEYGALLRTMLDTDAEAAHVAARNYYLNYITKTAKANGLVPFYWDNGVTGNNGFGLFDRSTGQKAHSDAISAIISAGN
ncbi:MAG: endoglucanase [Bacteroidetes bacterium]|jgi:endoglucanase|nr:endoglucanase [Bacteroidota bacterium]